MTAPDWTDGEVVEPPKLTTAQVYRLMRMTEVLRDVNNIAQVYEIKLACLDARFNDARGYWSDFSEDEQTALWVAPLYGGVFTTDERKALRPDG